MLSECRRRGTETAGRVREFDRDAGLADAAGGGMIHVRHHLPVTHLGMREDLGEREDRPVGHAGAVQDFYPGRCRSGLEDALQVADEYLAVSHPIPIGHIPGIVCHYRIDDLTAPPPDRPTADGHVEIAV